MSESIQVGILISRLNETGVFVNSDEDVYSMCNYVETDKLETYGQPHIRGEKSFACGCVGFFRCTIASDIHTLKYGAPTHGRLICYQDLIGLGLARGYRARGNHA